MQSSPAIQNDATRQAHLYALKLRQHSNARVRLGVVRYSRPRLGLSSQR